MITTLFLPFVLMVTGLEVSSQAEFQVHNREARTARERNDHEAYLRHVRAVQSLVPENASIRFALARAYALNGHEDMALAELAVLSQQGFGYRLAGEPAFTAMAGNEAFQKIANAHLENAKGSSSAYLGSIPLPDEIRGEAVAWSPSSASFLLGGEGGVYSVNPDEIQSRRLLTKWDAGVLGIRPDPATKTFLVCLNNESDGTARVQRHRLSDGAMLNSYDLPASGALCNDIAVLPQRSFAVTDSANGIVFKWDRGYLSALQLGQPLFLPNGIAADPQTGRLFVADAGGILVHDLAKKKSWRLDARTTSIAGIDGMVWHKGALIGVQNQTSPARLLQIRPNADARRASVVVLFSSPQLSNSATVAAIEEEAFVFTRPRGEDRDELPTLLRVRL